MAASSTPGVGRWGTSDARFPPTPLSPGDVRERGSDRQDLVPAEMYRKLIESVHDYAIFGLDAAGHVMTWNPGAQRFKGYTAAEIIGSHFSRFYPQEEIDSGKPARELEIAARDGSIEDEGWRLRKDGSRFWANVIISAIRDERGELIGYTKVTRDLTERRHADEALRQSEERFRLLVQNVKDYAILMLDRQGMVISWNDGAQHIKGYTAGEVIGRHFSIFYTKDAIDSKFPEQELEAAVRDGRFEDEGWRVRKDGTTFWANVVLTALRHTNGELIGFAKVTRDLTQRREAEAQARKLAAEQAAHEEATRRSEELAAVNRSLEAALRATTEAYRDLDQFAYVASHDLKAPLRGIANLAQWIQDDAGPNIDEPTKEHLQLLKGRVHRMEALIEGILTYSRAGRLGNAPEKVDIGALVREVIELLAVPASMQVSAPPDLPTIDTERVPLQQVLMNLIGNAVKYTAAARADGHVWLEWREEGEILHFTVRDNGPGIAPQYHDRIWGIFQTLNPRDKVEGTGIGLSVVKKIIESRGGVVMVESAPGTGATFRFTWPRTPRPNPRRDSSRESRERKTGGRDRTVQSEANIL